jgi:hypothetical protein
MPSTWRDPARIFLAAILAAVALAGSAATAGAEASCSPTRIDRWLYCGTPLGEGVSVKAALQSVLDDAFERGARPDANVECYDGELWPYPDQPPVVSGSLQVGSTLTSTTGGWFSCREFIRSYSWLWHGNSQTPSPNPYGSTYTTASSDVGAYLWTKVTACNTSQCVTSQYDSNHHGPVYAPQPDPPDCSDGADNDGDGLVDFRADDTGDWMGCGSAADDDEGGQWGDVYMPKDGQRHWWFDVIFRGYAGPADNPEAIRCYTVEGYIDDDVGIPRGPRIKAWHVKLVVDWFCVDGTKIVSIADDYTHEFDWDFPYALANPVSVTKIATLWVRPAAGQGGTRAEAEWDVESCTPSWAPFIGRQCTTRRLWIHIRIFGSGAIECLSSEGTGVCNRTTAVAMQAFSARTVRDSVVLRWRTAQELGLLGFNVYRAARKLNAGVIRANGSISGGAYRLVDAGHRGRSAARYRLEAVNRDGTTRSWFTAISR